MLANGQILKDDTHLRRENQSSESVPESFGCEEMIQLPGVGSASDPAHLSDKDAALAVVSDVAQEIDPVVGKRVLWKIDRYFMPAMLIGKLGIGF